MKSIYVIIIVCIMFAISAAGQESTNSTEVENIKQAVAAWDQAWDAGDADAVAALYTGDAVVMPPNEPAGAGRGKIRAGAQKYFDRFTDDNLAPWRTFASAGISR